MVFAHVLSDIHLELDNAPAKQDISGYFDSKADYLFLLGDIGNPDEPSYKRFLASCTAVYKKVFLVLGNHEFYGSCVERTLERVREICKGNDKLVFLNDDTFDLPELGVRIAGTTLWSDVTEEQMSDVRCFIADFRMIKGWSVYNHNYKHAMSVKWLEAEAQRAREDNVKLLVMTHHAPLPRSCHPKYLGSPLSSAFETDLSEFIKENEHIKVWLHGHTHYSDTQVVAGATVISNQYGYDAASEKFDRELRIDLATV